MNKKLWIFCIFILNVVQTWAQTSNPFDIVDRVKQVQIDTAVVKDGTILKDTVQKLNIPNTKSSTWNSDSVEFYQNPFEVSHVPIRKEKVKRENLAVAKKATADGNIKEELSSMMKFLIVMFSLALLAIVLTSKTDFFSKITRSISNENMLKLAMREENSGLTLQYVFMYIVFILNLSLFIYMCVSHFEWSKITGMKLFGVSTMITIGLYVIRHLGLYSLGMVFPLSKATSLYSFTVLIFNIFIGIILIPSNIILSFAPKQIFLPTVYVSLGIIIILLVLRWFRGFFISLKYITDNLFLFFLYLCSVEIAPLLILWKAISNQSLQ
jgi:hypothetical protein